VQQIQNLTSLEYQKRVCEAMNYISAHLNEELNLDHVAEVASFSKFHFHRIFKVVVGETVGEFTRRLRLERSAAYLCMNPHSSMVSVATEFGFSSSQNFAKVFKSHFGMTPTAYRKSKNGNIIRNNEHPISLQTLYDIATVHQQQSTQRSITMDVTIKTMPAFNVAYVRKMGPYGADVCGAAFMELMQWAGPKGYAQTQQAIGLYWDNPEVTPAEKCRMDACITLPEDTNLEHEMATQTLYGGRYAVCHFNIKGDAFHEAWEEAFRWVIQSGHECANHPPYEFYHNGKADAEEDYIWSVDICIPLQ